MRTIVEIIFCSFFLILTACSVHQTQMLHYKEVQSCKIACQQRFNLCNQACVNNCQQCTAYANQSALKSYKRYRQDLSVQGGTVARQLYSFHDPLQCRKTTCACKTDYRVCLQACTGTIHKRLQVAPGCC